MNIIRLSDETKNYMEIITRQMAGLGVLEEADRANLELLSSQIELYLRAMRELDEKGLTCTDQKGRMVSNPAFSVARSCMSQITSLLKELSLSTRQRRLLTRDAIIEEEDPMDVFLEKMESMN